MATTKWRITRQDKTRYDNSGELRALLIHQLVLVCWRAIPQTISFYNPEPSHLEMPRRGCTVALLQRCQVCTAACYNAARFALLDAATLPGLHCYMLQHCDMAAQLVPTFVLSWHTSPYFCVIMTLSPPPATSSRWSRFVKIPLVEPMN